MTREFPPLGPVCREMTTLICQIKPDYSSCTLFFNEPFRLFALCLTLLRMHVQAFEWIMCSPPPHSWKADSASTYA